MFVRICKVRMKYVEKYDASAKARAENFWICYSPYLTSYEVSIS